MNISTDSLAPNSTLVQKQAESRLEMIFEGQEISNDMINDWTAFLIR